MFSATTERRSLQRNDFAWKRPRYDLAPDPESEKKTRIRRRVNQLGPQWAVLFEDETDLRLFPNLRATWAKRGQSARVVLSGFNAKRVVFGALNFRTGHRLLLARPRQRQEDFQAFLSYLRWSYRRWDLLLVLDEDSCHTAKKSRQLAESIGIELEWLPARSPKLNPLDTLWGQAKDEVCSNWQYDNIEEQTTAFLSYIDRLSNRQILHTTGVLSGNFWLT